MDREENGLIYLRDDVSATSGDEAQCAAAEMMIIRCADALLSDEESRRQCPELWHHFRFCPDCAREYRLALHLAQLESDGQLERPAHIPPPPEVGQPTMWERAKSAITAIFPGFSLPPAGISALAGALTRGVDLGVEPVEVVLTKGKLRISFDIATNEQNTDLRDLFCTVSTGREEPSSALEGSLVWLHVDDEGPVIMEKALNELGDAAFPGLQPGQYTLRFHLAGEEYVITKIILP